MASTEEQTEPTFIQADIDRIWELFFGNHYSIHHIAQEYGESERRWFKNHPHQTNRNHLFLPSETTDNHTYRGRDIYSYLYP
jgi:hypothetical protein